MFRRKRRAAEPFQEGSLGEIYKLFLGKLNVYKPLDMTLQEWHEVLFDTKYRDIVMYETTKPFKMPGLYCQAPHVKIQGIGYRDIPVGTILYVRTDGRTGIVDVESFAGPGKKDQIFSLSTSEWNTVAPHVRHFVLKGKQRRRNYHGERG